MSRQRGVRRLIPVAPLLYRVNATRTLLCEKSANSILLQGNHPSPKPFQMLSMNCQRNSCLMLSGERRSIGVQDAGQMWDPCRSDYSCPSTTATPLKHDYLRHNLFEEPDHNIRNTFNSKSRILISTSATRVDL